MRPLCIEQLRHPDEIAGPARDMLRQGRQLAHPRTAGRGGYYRPAVHNFYKDDCDEDFEKHDFDDVVTRVRCPGRMLGKELGNQEDGSQHRGRYDDHGIYGRS